MIYFIQTIACSAIFYMAFHFLFKGKNEHVFNRFYLLSSILLAVVIPLCRIPVFPEYMTIVQAGKPIGNMVNNAVDTGYSFHWKDVLFAIYILGIIVRGALFAMRLLRISNIVTSGKKERGNGITKVLTSGDIPVSSFLSYLFVPNENEKSITAYECYHEEVHIRQKHSWDILFTECLGILFWFNPFMILYKNRLVEIHEFLADEQSSRRFGQADYEQFLALKTCNSEKEQLIHNFYTLFEKRIEMMNTNESTKKWQYALVLPIIAMVLMAFSFENYPVYNVEDGNQLADFHQDSFPPLPPMPPIPPELVGQELDTIITFDPVTYEQSVSYVISTGITSGQTVAETPLTGIDTLIIFDPSDFSETMIIMNHDTGQVDTIR